MESLLAQQENPVHDSSLFGQVYVNPEVCSSFITTTVWVQHPCGHTTRTPQVEFELATKGIQIYVLANLDNDDNLVSFLSSSDVGGY